MFNRDQQYGEYKKRIKVVNKNTLMARKFCLQRGIVAEPVESIQEYLARGQEIKSLPYGIPPVDNSDIVELPKIDI